MASGRGRRPKAEDNFWSFLTRVCLRSMDRGQFPALAIAAVLVIVVLRLPPELIVEVLTKILDHLENAWFLGYVFGILELIAFILIVGFMRRTHREEMSRVADERNHWQERALGKGNVDSSESEEEEEQ